MFWMLTAMTVLSTPAQAAPDPDVGEPVAACDRADFPNQGQWIRCLTDEGLRGRALARAIHDEYLARTGAEPTPQSRRRARLKARRATARAEGREPPGRRGPVDLPGC